MARPTTKAQLLEAAANEFEQLINDAGSIDAGRRAKPGACGEWSVKDLLAHVDAWHELFLEWERVGSTGEKPAMPAAGFTFSETPALNDEIFQRCRNDAWGDVNERLQRSHRRILAVIESYDADELFTKKRFAWTGSTSVGSYAVSATSSHYAWASKLVRKLR